MGNKVVVFPELVSQLSETTSTSEALCESFLKSFFVLASEQLEQGNRIEIKHIGVFYVGEEGVVFEASEEIKSSVNAAFDCFEPIELDEDYDGEECGEECVDEDLSNDQIEGVTEDLSVEEEGRVEEVGKVVDGRSESSGEFQGKEVYDGPGGSEDQYRGVSGASSDGTKISESDIIPISDEEGSESDENIASSNVWRFPFVMGFLSGVAIMLILVVVLWYMGFVLLVGDWHKEQSTVNAEEKVVLTDNAPERPSEGPTSIEQEEPVAELAVEKQGNLGTYKVTKTAYLSNISRKYYGHYVFWVYIYLENKDLIKDPDNLPVGVELTIPSPAKYGIDKDDEQSVKKAELKAFEVKNGRI